MTHRVVRSCIAGFLATALAVVLSGCAGAAPYRDAASAPAGAAQEYAEAPAPAAQAADAGAADIANRMVIRNASLTLVVADTAAQVDAITRLASELQGYVSASSATQYDEGLQARITLRIPADKLDLALQRLRGLAVEVREEQISGEDVTAEYTDLGSRLKNLEAAEAQLRAIMEQATETEDVLSVFQKLTEVRGEIEVIKGRMQYLSQAAALATVTVTLIPDKMAQPVQVAGWRLDGVAKQAFEALIAALQALATLAVWFVIVLLPVGLLLASPFILLFVILRRRSRRNRQAAAK
jgi:hypothetical protein